MVLLYLCHLRTPPDNSPISSMFTFQLHYQEIVIDVTEATVEDDGDDDEDIVDDGEDDDGEDDDALQDQQGDVQMGLPLLAH